MSHSAATSTLGRALVGLDVDCPMPWMPITATRTRSFAPAHARQTRYGRNPRARQTIHADTLISV
jgi:hypothetical protein